jgi:antitoxin ParD1/3/4
MPRTQSLTITLPEDATSLIASKIATGAYATASDVIQASLLALQDQDMAMDEWLKTEVTKSYDEVLADPTTAIPAEQVMDRIRTTYSELTKTPARG